MADFMQEVRYIAQERNSFSTEYFTAFSGRLDAPEARCDRQTDRQTHTHTHTHTHTQDNYNNPCACAPRVNKEGMLRVHERHTAITPLYRLLAAEMPSRL